MSAATFVAVIALAWIVLIALIVALFHGWRWIDRAVEEEMNLSAGGYGPANRGEQREDAR